MPSDTTRELQQPLLGNQEEKQTSYTGNQPTTTQAPGELKKIIRELVNALSDTPGMGKIIDPLPLLILQYSGYLEKSIAAHLEKRLHLVHRLYQHNLTLHHPQPTTDLSGLRDLPLLFLCAPKDFKRIYNGSHLGLADLESALKNAGKNAEKKLTKCSTYQGCLKYSLMLLTFFAYLFTEVVVVDNITNKSTWDSALFIYNTIIPSILALPLLLNIAVILIIGQEILHKIQLKNILEATWADAPCPFQICLFVVFKAIPLTCLSYAIQFFSQFDGNNDEDLDLPMKLIAIGAGVNVLYAVSHRFLIDYLPDGDSTFILKNISDLNMAEVSANLQRTLQTTVGSLSSQDQEQLQGLGYNVNSSTSLADIITRLRRPEPEEGNIQIEVLEDQPSYT